MENVSFSYPGQPPAVKNVSLIINAGERAALLGANGAGKSTIARLLTGLIKPSAGRVVVAGHDTRHITVAALARFVGYVGQNPDHQICQSTVRAEVAFGLHTMVKDRHEIAARVEEALKAVGLENHADQHPLDLSRGQRQRLVLATILARRPQILILDEPTTGQDWYEARQIMETITNYSQQSNTSLLFITHDVEMAAEKASRILLMYEGQIIADGKPEEVFYQSELLYRCGLEPPFARQVATSFSFLPAEIVAIDQLITYFRTIRKG